MPPGPRVTRTVSTRLSGNLPAATSEDFGGAEAAGLSDLGQGLVRTGFNMQQRREKDAAIFSQKSALEFSIRESKNLREAVKNLPFDQDPGDFTSNFMAGAEERARALLETMPTKAARQNFDLRMTAFLGKVEDDASTFESERRAGFKFGQLTDSTRLTAQSLADGALSFPEAVSEIDQVVNSMQGFLSPKVIMAQKTSALRQAVLADIEATAQQDPELALKRIDSGIYDKHISATELLGKKKQLKAKTERVSKMDADILEGKIEDALNETFESGHSDERQKQIESQIKSTIKNKDDQEFAIAQYKRQNEMNAVGFQVTEMVSNGVGGFKPYSREARTHALMLAEKWADAPKPEALEEGQVGPTNTLLSQSDKKKFINGRIGPNGERIGGLVDAMIKDMENMFKDRVGYFSQKDDDLKALNDKIDAASSPEERLSLERQRDEVVKRLQIDAGFDDLVLLSQNTARSMVAEFEKKARTDPEAAAQEYLGLMDRYEDDFQAVISQLEDEKLNPLFRSIAHTVDNPLAQNILVQALSINQEKLKNVIASDTLTGTKFNDDVVNHNLVQDFKEAVTKVPGQNVDTVFRTQEAIKRVAQIMVFNGQASSLSDGIDKAAEMVIPWKFGEVNGRKFMINKLNRDPADVNRIEDNAIAFMEFWEQEPLRHFSADNFGGEDLEHPARVLLFAGEFRRSAFLQLSKDGKRYELWMTPEDSPNNARRIMKEDGSFATLPITMLEAEALPLSMELGKREFIKFKQERDDPLPKGFESGRTIN